MPLFALIDDFPSLVRALADRYPIEVIANGTGISSEDLMHWRQGGNHYRPQAEWLLYGFCINRGDYDLVRPVLPTFDRTKSFDLDSPPLGFDIEPPLVQLRNRPTLIAGRMVNFPFGISASVLTRNAKTVAFYSARGFDILTYKTVRSTERIVHKSPNWSFISSRDVNKIKPPFANSVEGAELYWPQDPSIATMANSFGIPSPEPSVWQPDVEQAKGSLRPGQILVVSVTASPPEGDTSKKTLIDDFVRVAQLAKEAGADIIEANYSCPNTSGDQVGDLYRDPELSGEVSAAISRSLGTTPLFVKIGYLEKPKLNEFLRYNRGHIQGIIAINTISMQVLSPAGKQLFPGNGRERAGVSGAAIRPWARQVVSDLIDIRQQEKAEDEFAIIAVGGANTPQDIYDYLNLGADAVESCTAAYLNPYLAIETRMQLSKIETSRERMDLAVAIEDVFSKIETELRPLAEDNPDCAEIVKRAQKDARTIISEKVFQRVSGQSQRKGENGTLQKETAVHPEEIPQSSLAPEELEETSLNELVSAWEIQYEISHEESRQYVAEAISSLRNTLEIGGKPFFFPIDDEYSIMVKKKSDNSLTMTKIKFEKHSLNTD